MSSTATASEFADGDACEAPASTATSTNDNREDHPQASMLETIASQILEEATREVDSDNDDDAHQQDPIQRMEQWLGIQEPTPATAAAMMLTAEDCAPFSIRVYQLVGDMVQWAWHPQASTKFRETILHHQHDNVLIQHYRILVEKEQQQQQQQMHTADYDRLAEQLSLDACLDAVRVTKWMAQWMDLNCSQGEQAQVRSFTQYFLLGPNSDNDNPSFADYAPAVMAALFHHVSQLPQYQSQVHLFCQSFQRGDLQRPPKPPAGSKTLTVQSKQNTALNDPTNRLQQYQRAQQLTQRLTQEWNVHLQRLEKIMGEFYQTSPPALRSMARAGLGQVWTSFAMHHAAAATTGTSAANVRGENTSASGLDVTLRVLYRILLGTRNISAEGEKDSSNQRIIQQQAAVHEHLLLQVLLPLHQPHSMVLWRDQTCLLELYHEPLVQCMAFLLQKYPHHLPDVCHALLHPSEGLWPIGGNTPKQVLILHEIDTYLTMMWNQHKQQQQQKSKDDQECDADGKTTDLLVLFEEATFCSLLGTVAACMASEHSGLAERSLTLLRNKYFHQLVYDQFFERSLAVLLPALVHKTTPGGSVGATVSVPWNPTVRKMTFYVLKNLQQHDPTIFAQVAGQVLSDRQADTTTSDDPNKQNGFAWDHNRQQQQPDTSTTVVQNAKGKGSALPSSNKPMEAHPSSGPAFNQRFSLQAGMGNWRPPPSAAGSGRNKGRTMPPPSARPPPTGGQPPLGVTGVAPWATSSSSADNPPVTVTGVAPWATSPPPPSNIPPLTVTGVAPWAASSLPPTRLGRPRTANPPLPPTHSTTTKASTSSLPPIPGVTSNHLKRRGGPAAPLAGPIKLVHMSDGSNCGATASSSCGNLPAGSNAIMEDEGGEENSSSPPTEEKTKDDNDAPDMPEHAKTNLGLWRVLQYTEQLKPPGTDEDAQENDSSPWSKAQMAETPTLLPELKFHDLVFGHELGSGAFGVVKYARLIDRTKTRSQWAEYAVKIIATQRMKELGYEQSVAREIACLRLIGHPCTARLVSSFRFNEGAYLVLEYASGGDLHRLLQQHGSLDIPSCQFVMGEVVAALASLHEDLGMVYGDLKPENVVLTETGHVKLTDFGACRPYTEAARAMVKEQIGKGGKNLLENLREGDPRKLRQHHEQFKESAIQEASDKEVWRDNEESQETDHGWDHACDGAKAINDYTMEVVDGIDDVPEDLRVEGTTAYLPPEVVLGSIPTPAADSWAFGCVLYQCLTGRPPMLEEDETMTRHRIVTFGDHGGDHSTALTHEDPLFGSHQKHAADVPDNARNLIRSLLDRLPTKRPSMQQVARHAFFEGQDVFCMYLKPAYPLDVGQVAPPPADSRWSRRQFSSIWAPQPHAYDLSGASDGSTRSRSSGNVSAPIPEGDEATTYFSASSYYRATIRNTSNSNESEAGNILITSTRTTDGSTASDGPGKLMGISEGAPLT